MYYLVESDKLDRSDENPESVIKLIDDDEREQLNVNLPDESEFTDDTPVEDSEDETKDSEVTPTESRKYELPKISHAKFEKVKSKYSPYANLPGVDYVILGHNIQEGIEVAIHGVGGQVVVSTKSDIEFFKNYCEAKKYVIRSVLNQHNDYLKESLQSNYDKNLKDIYESCNDILDNNIKMILHENSLKVVYPKERKSVLITHDKDNYRYVVESRVGKEVTTNTISDIGIVMYSRDIIKSIIMGG